MHATTYLAIRALPVLILAFGCGPETGMIEAPTGEDVAEPSLASERFSDWSPPVNVGAGVNSAFVENAPELSKDGLSLYFGSNRPGGQGLQDLYVSQRSGLDAPWGVPINLGPLMNSPFTDVGPHLSRDGHLLFFSSSRPGGSGSADVWVSRRRHIHDDFGWEQPVNLGSPPNSARFEGAVSIWGPELYFWRGTPDPAGLLAPTDGDIYISEITGQTFGEPTLVTELSSVAHEQRPSIRFDGREIFLSSDRAGSIGLPGSALREDLWTSLRQGNGKLWEAPANLGPVVNGSFRDTQPALSDDGTMLFFLSDRPGGSGNLDIYVTTRTVRNMD
jgi:hypothetical protein